MKEQFARQSFLGADSEQLFVSLRAGIVGLGGGGSHMAQQLAHVGVGHFALFDPDVLEMSNLNRTVGATYQDARAGLPKVRIAERLITSVNPSATVWSIQKPWQDDFLALRACDVVFGCLDGFTLRAQLEESCRRALIPLIDIGMDVYESNPFSIVGQMVSSMPAGPCFRCVQLFKEADLNEEAARYGVAGENPQVIWPNGILASTAVGFFVQLFAPWCPTHQANAFVGYDGNKFKLEQDVRLTHAPKCEHFKGIADLGDPFWQA